MNVRKTIRNTAIAGVLGLSLAACGTGYDTGSDRQGINANGAITHREAPTLNKCYGPNQGGYGGYGNKVFYYPVGQRTYDASTDKGAESGPVKITFGTVGIDVPITAYFYLTSNCNLLKKFHSEIGSKGWGEDGTTPAYIKCEACEDPHFADGKTNYAGWDSALQKYMGRPVTRAATDAAVLTDSKLLNKEGQPLRITPISLMDGTDRAAYEAKIAELLPKYVKALSGQDYFTKFTVQVGTPTPPQEYADALTSRETARLLNLAQQEKNTAITTELNSIRDLVAVLGPQGYIAYQQNKLTERQNTLLEQAIKEGKIQVLPVPMGANMNLTVPNGAR
jgi:hypothetical protein